ncbi:hypothetical protein FH972_010311 [Carpinus fangiana]|uniref:PGG domain-containing protein n=1 Tax=Carpinus fangiana TaxID=176857 RepID=A0A660KMV7_9ROSI|nr:hypothetical protein FH972_010311 [Carpinus fangiana]
MDENLGDIALLRLVGSLRNAAEEGNIDALYALIERDAKVLKWIDKIPFVETPLHTAASAGQTEFAMEIMRLKPSFARKLNQNGFTPVHLALQMNHTQLVHRLLDVDETLVRVQGKEGVTPLHYVVQTGNLEVLLEFLKVCPKSIEDITIRRETVLHIALKYNMFDAFQLLLGWLQRAWFRDVSRWEKLLLNWKDDKGNTVLHIAASKNQSEIVRLLLKFNTVDVNVKDTRGRKALDMLQVDNPQSNCARHLTGLKLFCTSDAKYDANYFKSVVSIEEMVYIMFLRLTTNISNDMRNVLLVVAALLITVSFQAAISPPGGVWQEDGETHDGLRHYAATSIMENGIYSILAGLNAISFFVTVFATFLLLPSGFGTRLFCLPLYTLSLYFIASLCLLSPKISFPHEVIEIWKIFILSCVISPGGILLLVVFVSVRRNKLVVAFRPRVKVLDTTLTM